ncbi:MAG: lamin tail domain-containing protein, partial [Saprospiraceae bacterium]
MTNHINFLILFIGLFFYSTNIQAQLYSETFSGQNGKGVVGPTPTVDETGVNWNVSNSSTTTGLTATTDWFQVQNEVMEARDVDEEVVWESPSIDITGLTSTINLSVDFAEDGNLESGDYAKAYYILDSDPEVQFATNGNNSDDFTAVRAEQVLDLSTITVTSLKIVIRIDNNAGTEYIRFDNVSVIELAACAAPADQATALTLSPNTTRIMGSFTEANSSPDNYLVVMSTTSTLSSSPIDGTTYNIGDAIGGGIVVTKLSLTTFSATELAQGTQYYFYIFSYNTICNGGPKYNLTSPLTGNTTTATTPDIIITEVMFDPVSPITDANGEYFEIYNNSGSTVDINGWVLKDADGQSHTISGSLTIASGAYLVLARNSDRNVNGDFASDYDYSSITFTNGEDEIILEDSNGNEVDKVIYDNTFPSTNGSMYLVNIPSDNNVGSNWAASTTSEGITTGKGSPGNIGEATLPVEFSDFYSEKINNAVQLFWETRTELNNSHFEIERSTNGKKFVRIGEVQGNGTALETQLYNFVDNSPQQINYYRLKQIDFDGQFEYSKTIVVNMEHQATLDIRVFPNPTKNKFNIDFTNIIEQDVRIEIYNMNGQQVRSQILN